MTTEHLDATHATMMGALPLADAPDRLLLRVFNGHEVKSVPLPREGVVTLGRSSGADVLIDSPSVSRVHARLHVGKTVQVEDLGSANGTKVRGATLAKGQRVDVLPGEELLVGNVPCLLQGAPRFAPPRPRALRSHEYFEARLDDECGAASAASGAFTLLRLRVEGAGAGFEESLLASTQAAEVVALYGPGDYELLLPGAAGRSPRGDEIVAALKRAGWEPLGASASFPRDGRTADPLMEALGEAIQSPPPAAVARSFGDVVVADPAMRELHALVARFAASEISVLLLGETGTGKEVFAAQVHKLSARAAGPFCKLNCAAFTETLVESELFGHEKGAFTGADRAQAGLLESAQGGTVFLDEVGELPLSLQAKLLRVLEDRKVRRIGGREERALDVRFISATNRDLEREIEAGRFRSDLYFRLNGFPFEIPALRARVAEVEPLALRFLALGAARAGRAAPTLTAGALAALQGYAWPGNIRELRNVIDRVLVIADGLTVTPDHLRMASSKLAGAARAVKPAAEVARAEASPPSSPHADLTVETVRTLSAVLDDAERDYVRRVLEVCTGNQTRAAELLDISRGKMVNLIEKHKLPRPRGGG